MIPANMLLIKPSPSIFLKSEKVKKHFNKKLRENIKCALNRNEILFTELIQARGRLYLQTEQIGKAQKIMHKVFGIHSTAQAFEFNALTMDSIKENTLAYCADRLDKGTIAVRASRSGEQKFKSQEIERETGAVVLEKFPKLSVNLSNPKTTISIELRKEKGICYVEELMGFAGLPLGVEGNIAMFFQGKPGELTAAFLLMKRGANIYPIGKDCKKVREILSALKEWNSFREFLLSSEKELGNLIRERNILVLASADTGISKKDFSDYQKFDAKQGLPVLRPLLFVDLKELKKIIAGA